MGVSNNPASRLKKTAKFSLYCLLIAFISFILLAVGMHSAVEHDRLFIMVRNIKRVLAPPPPPSPQVISHHYFNEFNQLIKDTSKILTDAPIVTDKTIIAFVFGQSNSANSEGERYKADTKNVYNYFDNHYYIASDPLLGATGNAGSVWTITANKLIKKNIADKVILIAAGVGGTSVKSWREGGELNNMLESRLKNAQKNNISITHFLWHQGESDNGVYESEYENGLTEVIHLTQLYYPNAKFFVSQASAFCNRTSSNLILKSQRNVTQLKNVYRGPNTDLIGADDRWDGCHLSGRGIEKASNEWVELIDNPIKTSDLNSPSP